MVSRGSQLETLGSTATNAERGLRLTHQRLELGRERLQLLARQVAGAAAADVGAQPPPAQPQARQPFAMSVCKWETHGTQRFCAATRTSPLVLCIAVLCPERQPAPSQRRLQLPLRPDLRLRLLLWLERKRKSQVPPVVECAQVRVSWTKTEPAGARICISPGMGAVTVMPSCGERGFRGSRCD